MLTINKVICLGCLVNQKRKKATRKTIFFKKRKNLVKPREDIPNRFKTNLFRTSSDTTPK